MSQKLSFSMCHLQSCHQFHYSNMYVYDACAKYISYKKRHYKIRRKFPNGPVPNMTAICIFVKRFQSTGSILDDKSTHRKHEWTRKKLDEIGVRLGTCPRKSLAQIAQQTDMTASSAPIATKLLHLHQCKTTVVHRLYNTDCEVGVNTVNWYFYGFMLEK